MGPVARSWFACLAVVFSACSLVVDFPDKAPVADAGEDELDARVDAANEAGADVTTRDATADAGRDSGPECSQDTDCNNDQLCCPGQNNAPSCVATNVERCTACGMGCTDPRAPNCGARVCECVKDTGKGCDPGQTCDVTSGTARCVECANDNDCAQVTGKPLCENNKCVACQRGANAASPADDKGCTDARAPFCGPENTCIGCDDSKPETKCAEGTVCSPGLGCGGCKADVPTVGLNGCTMESLPICKTTMSGLTQCQACMANTECKFPEGQGYCATGRCSNKCDGDGALGANGCTAASGKPYCKAASGVAGGFDCAACSAADCTNGTFCATTGAKAGSCVQCRSNIDCPQNGLVPICDAATFTCRARTMADCAAPTPYLSTAGTCVECLPSGGAAHCATSTKGPVCNPTTNTCVACASSADCPATTPTCNPVTNACAATCASDGFCRGAHPATPKCNASMMACVECKSDGDCTTSVTKPLCNLATNTCVACTSTAACQTKIAGTNCFPAGAGAYAGACGDCIPGGPAAQCTAPKACSTQALCE